MKNSAVASIIILASSVFLWGCSDDAPNSQSSDTGFDATVTDTGTDTGTDMFVSDATTGDADTEPDVADMPAADMQMGDVSPDADMPASCSGLGLMAFDRNLNERAAWAVAVQATAGGDVATLGDPVSLGPSEQPRDVAFSADGRTALVTLDTGPPAVVRLEFDDTCIPAVTGRVDFELSVVPNGIAFAPDGTTATVSLFENRLGVNQDSADIGLLELSGDGTLQLSSRVTVRGGSASNPGSAIDIHAGLTAAHGGGVLVIPNDWNNAPRIDTEVWDAAASSWVGGSSVSASPGTHMNVAASPGGELILLPQDDGTVALFHVSADGSIELRDTVSLTGTPRAVAFSPDGSYALVTDYSAHRVEALGVTPDALTVMGGVLTGDATQENPDSVAISSIGNLALVGNRLDDDVAVIDLSGAPATLTRTGELALSIDGAAGPFRIGFAPQ